MQKSTSRAMNGTGAVRALLAERLAEAGLSQSVDQLIAQAKWAERPGPVARALGTTNVQPVALAMMLARAEEGRIEDALALSALAVERRPSPVLRTFLDALERAAQQLDGPLVDGKGRPIVFVVSYPRSGNTRFLNIMAGAFPNSRYTALFGEGRYVSPHGRGSVVNGPAFVKDHTLRDQYRQNPVIYLARDGRDCCLSFNDFKLRRPEAGEAAITAGADSLAMIVEPGPGGAPAFGGWPRHMSAALDWREAGGDLTIVTYDALMAEDSFGIVAAALAGAGVDLSRERYAKGLDNAAEKETQLRAQSPNWARERIYPQGSMMDRWLDTEGVRKWRTLLGPDEKARLHGAGFTQPLIRAGFEQDPNWWKDV